MSGRRYRTRQYMQPGAAGYALAAIAELADGSTYPPVTNGEQAREWAQRVLDDMVAAGYIEPRDEDES